MELDEFMLTVFVIQVTKETTIPINFTISFTF
jgi:hypothetical protein